MLLHEKRQSYSPLTISFPLMRVLFTLTDVSVSTRVRITSSSVMPMS